MRPMYLLLGIVNNISRFLNTICIGLAIFRSSFIIIVLLLMQLLIACRVQTQDILPPGIQIPQNGEPERSLATTTSIGYTYQREDGNRLQAGHGSLQGISPIDIKIGGEPCWIVGVPLNGDSVWAIVLKDGRVEGFHISEKRISTIPIEPNRVPPCMPPILKVESGKARLVIPTTDSASTLTHPVVLASSGYTAFIEANGDLVVMSSGKLVRLRINALPDARILADEKERLLVLSDATERYGHGVLGDRVEAASITIVETREQPQVALTIPISDGDVVEGIAPIWADITGDNKREIIVTVSNANRGARVVVFSEEGKLMAAGPAIGPSRWRHQLAVGAFGPNGEIELCEVATPHIGGIVGFYRLEGDSLNLKADLRGYTSHVMGSRNLDMVLAADFDGDAILELLLPNQARTELGAIKRNVMGAAVSWIIPIGGRLSTNLAAVTLGDGSLAIAIGREDETMRFWLP